MNAEIFCLALVAFFTVLYGWAFRTLPREHWQFFAILPLKKNEDGTWKGVNMTFYGVFTAIAGVLAISLFLLLTFSVGIQLSYVLLLTGVALAICLPAARIVNYLVEKKSHGFTVGGASFVGIIVLPLMLLALDQLAQMYFSTQLPVMPILAAMVIAYIIGEGVGRLACLSFGCCHGKPVSELKAITRRVFSRWSDVYEGEMKKISYCSKLHNTPVVPIQSITTTLYTIVGIAGIYLFLNGLYASAFLLCLLFSQIWRVVSEFYRADFRGFNKVTAYQWMAMIACLYGVALFVLMPSHQGVIPELSLGFTGLFDIKVFIALQVFGLIMFFFSGTSTVTQSKINFSIDLNRI